MDSTLFFILSTYENGEAPENASDFWDSLNSIKDELKGVSFSTFGIGNSKYKETYQAFSRKVNKKLKELGATVVIESAEGDAADSSKMDSEFENWKSRVLKFAKQVS